MRLPSVLRTLLATPFLLALAPLADEIAFGPAARSEVAKKLEIEIELAVDDVTFTVDGRSMPPEALGSLEGQDLLVDLAIGVTEKYVESRDGRPIDLLRTYDEVSVRAELGEDSQEPDASKLVGKTVRFLWNDNAQAYDKSYHESEGDAGVPSPLCDDMDLRLLLPPKKVAEGDTWEIPGERLLPLFLPGIEGGELGDDALADDAAKFFEVFQSEVGAELQAFLENFRVRCQYEGTREVDGVRVAEIGFAFAGGPKLDVAGLIRRLAEMQGGGGGRDVDVTGEFACELEGQGSLLWNQAAGRMHTFDMRSDVAISLVLEMQAEAEGQSHELSLEASLGGQAKWTMKAEAR